LAAVTHVDGTARLQTVTKQSNPEYYRLISEFGTITGIPALLNTSFNNQCEPIVDNPEHAVNCFLSTHLDALIIGEYVIEKNNLHTEPLLLLYPKVPPFISLHCEGNNGTVIHEIRNTYNTKRLPISSDVYDLLKKCEGYKTFKDLLGTSFYSANDVAVQKLKSGITQLWNQRIVQVSPSAH